MIFDDRTVIFSCAVLVKLGDGRIAHIFGKAQLRITADLAEQFLHHFIFANSLGQSIRRIQRWQLLPS